MGASKRLYENSGFDRCGTIAAWHEYRGLHPAIPDRADWRLRVAGADGAAVVLPAIEAGAAPAVAPFATRPVARLELRARATVKHAAVAPVGQRGRLPVARQEAVFAVRRVRIVRIDDDLRDAFRG